MKRLAGLLAAALVLGAGAANAIDKNFSRGAVLRAPQDIKPSAVECGAFVQDLLAFVAADLPNRRIGAKMSSAKITQLAQDVYPWGHGAYSEGAFGWAGSKLSGRFLALFSDRRAADQHRFDKDQADIQDVTLYSDGRVEIVLRSWGDVLLPLEEVRCYSDGFLTGLNREGNGVSMVSFALRKEVITPGSHPAVNWP